MKRKKLTSILVAATMLTAAVPIYEYSGAVNDFVTVAESTASIIDSGECGAEGDNVTYTLDSNGVLTISGEGKMDDFDSEPWILHCLKINKAIIADGVTNIEYRAFGGCELLTEVIIPDSVTSICENAFLGCKSLEKITIPNSVTSIGAGTFYGCESLTEIIIPDSVKSIGMGAFGRCESLTEITLPKNLTSIESCLFYCCESLSKIEIPDSVTNIHNSAFMDCFSLTNIKIPDGVKSIEGGTFSGCELLTEITIPNSVTSIGECAFGNCYQLDEITIYNPECEIFFSENTITEKSIIRGFSNSTAEEYAKKYNRSFESLGERPVITTAATTTSTTTTTTAKTTTTNKPTTTIKPVTTTTAHEILEPTLLGDANCDGKVSIADAAAIFQSLGNPDKYGLSEQGAANADIADTGNGVTPEDAVAIQKIDAKLE